MKGFTRSILAGLIIGLGSIHTNCLAQFCNESTIKTIYSQDFGSGSAQPLPVGQTTYTYRAGNCIENGEYGILSALTASCFGWYWHEVPQDHTPNDVNGNMMLVNASASTGEFYKQAISNVCGNVSYELSLWCLNLINKDGTIDPAITINVETPDGTLIQTMNTGVIERRETPTWARYAVPFTVPAGNNDIVIKLVTSERGGSGNDIMVDDIQINQCGTCFPFSLYIPDAFSPNNDNLNDSLAIYLAGNLTFRFTVFNRWGEVIFTSSDVKQAWDGTYQGKPCSEGIYTWAIDAEVTGTTDSFSRQGQVVLLR